MPLLLCSPKGSTERVDELNDAIQKIDYVQPALQDTLFARYFRDAENDFTLTEQERADLSALGTLEVLCIDYDASYVYQQDGTAKGMLIFLLDGFSGAAGVTLHYTFCETRSEAVNQHKADAAAGDRSLMEYYIYDTASRLTTSLIIGETQKVGIGVSKECGFELMEVINRYINSLSDLEMTQYLNEGNTHADVT